MNLIIVESPTKAKTLARFLGQNYQIEASMGHIRDLPERKLGIDIEHDFAPEYVIADKKQEIVNRLKTAAEKAESVILASDPDREGEAISFHVASILKGKNIQRITFHEITESAIKEALNHPGEINMQLVDAQQARRILDRLVGYKLSPLLWRKVRKGLSAGRVQSVAVRLVVEREKEIAAFKPEEYWEIEVKVKSKKSKVKSEEFIAKLIKQEIKNKEEAEKIVESLKVSAFKVEDIQSKEVRKSPYPPFTTSTMQQAGSNVFGWSAKKTMQTAQALYEQGLITYHRTDSLNLAGQAVSAVRDFIKGRYGQDYLPDNPRFYKTKSKVAQEAHEAIRPTSTNYQLPTNNHDEKKLYELIWKRFVACQMMEAVYEQTSVDISAASYMLRATGSKVLFDGWRILFKDQKDEDVSNGLPQLTVSDALELLEVIPSQHFTEPPPRYNEASLIKTMEEYGIGRPSTYAPIISTIQDRQYVEKTDRRFFATSLGIAVNDFLTANFAQVLDYQFTAGMEDNLDAIANGEKQWVPVIREFYEPFAKNLENVSKTAEMVKVEVEKLDEECPNCHSSLVIRIGRFGKFIACSKFPECKFTKPLVNKLGMKCPKCKEGDVVIKRTKTRKSFYGCSRYPDCDFASWTKPK